MSCSGHDSIVDHLAAYNQLVEVAIGNRTDIAIALCKRGCTVTATDIYQCDVPADVHFVRDDITDFDPSVYTDADAIYALNLPPELHQPTLVCARAADADFLFTTLGCEQPTIPVDRITCTHETLFVAE